MKPPNLIYVARLWIFLLILGCKKNDKKVSSEERILRSTEGNEAVYVGKLGIVSDDLYLMRGKNCVLMNNQKVVYSGDRSGVMLKVTGSEVAEVHDEANLDQGIYVYVGQDFFHIISSDANGRRRGWKYKRGDL